MLRALLVGTTLILVYLLGFFCCMSMVERKPSTVAAIVPAYAKILQDKKVFPLQNGPVAITCSDTEENTMDIHECFLTVSIFKNGKWKIITRLKQYLDEHTYRFSVELYNHSTMAGCFDWDEQEAKPAGDIVIISIIQQSALLFFSPKSNKHEAVVYQHYLHLLIDRKAAKLLKKKGNSEYNRGDHILFMH